MRNSKAKFLRKSAKAYTTGNPWAQYVGGANPKFVFSHGHFRRTSPGVPTTLVADCGRSIYQKTKRALS